ISAVASHFRANEIGLFQEVMSQIRVPTVEMLKDLQGDLNQTQSKGRQTILAGTQPTKRDAAKTLFDSAWNDVQKDVAGLGELAPHWSIQGNRDRLAHIQEQLPKLRQVQEQSMNMAASGDRNAVLKGGDEFADKTTVISEDIKKSLGEMADSNDQLVKKNKEEISAANSSLVWTLWGTVLTIITFGSFVAIFLSRKISNAASSAL